MAKSKSVVTSKMKFKTLNIGLSCWYSACGINPPKRKDGTGVNSSAKTTNAVQEVIETF